MTDHNRVDEFLRLHARHESRVHAFILSLLPNWGDSQDVMQETVTVLWSKFDEFRPGSSYFAWACQVARFEVSRFLRRQHRDRLRFDDGTLELIAEATSEMDEHLAARQRALATCLEKLPEKDRALLGLRYHEGLTAKRIAKRVGRSVHAVYKATKRIRRILFDCVNGALVTEGRA